MRFLYKIFKNRILDTHVTHYFKFGSSSSISILWMIPHFTEIIGFPHEATALRLPQLLLNNEATSFRQLQENGRLVPQSPPSGSSSVLETIGNSEWGSSLPVSTKV